jgi:hypothetical protein
MVGIQAGLSVAFYHGEYEARGGGSVTSQPDPYELLGVHPGSSPDQLKRAYRRALARAHPDRGGTTEEFVEVQSAWGAIQVPEPEPDSDPSGSSKVARGSSSPGWMAPSPAPTKSSGSGARSHGHPGGWFRERYGNSVREWLGRGVQHPNVFDPELVSRAPANIRHILHAAIAEENTAGVLAQMGPSYEIWHDVLVEGSRTQGARKIDHIVVGPSRLWALQSEDWGPVTVDARGEIVGEGVEARERPVKELAHMVRKLQRKLGVRFSAMAYVVPDACAPAPVTAVASVGRMPVTLVDTSSLLSLVQEELPPGARSLVGDDMFPLRERLRAGIEFV